MWELSIRFLFLSEIPQTVALTLLAFAIARLEFKPVPVLVIGTVEAMVEFLVRKYPFPGFNAATNMLVIIGALAILLYIYQRKNMVRLITASFLASATLLLLDLATAYLVVLLWPHYFEVARKNDVLFAAGSYPFIAVMLALAFYIHGRNKRM